MEKVKKNKGITLIALVITIVILLILSGITIRAITGNNGIIKEARDAKKLTEMRALEEQIEMTIIKVEQKHRNPTMEQVSTEIEKIEHVISVNRETGDIENNLGNPVKGKLNDYVGKVAAGGNTVTGNITGGNTTGGTPEVPTFRPEELTIGTGAQSTDKYGYRVTNYNVKTAETGCWRLFYQDTNYTYLISDNCIGNYKPSDYYTTMKNGEGVLKYQTGADVSTVGQKLSPIISSLFTSSRTTGSIRATAWLTDTSDSGMWSSYKNADAVFAIGSPTAELFAASYNNRSNKSNTIILGLGAYGYTQNTDFYWLATEDNHGIYNKSSSSYWWLASPQSRRKPRILCDG